MTVESEPLVGSRCRACSERYYPPLVACPSCYARQMEPYTLPERGVLYSYSVVRIGPKGIPVPYAVGYADLSDGVRVFARIEGWQEGGLRCDLPVQVGLRRGDGAEPLCVARLSEEGRT